MTYDVENRLTRVQGAGGTTDYVYNGDGARVKKVANGISTFYVGNFFLVSVNGQVTTPSKYYYFGSLRVARQNDQGVFYLNVDQCRTWIHRTRGSQLPTLTQLRETR